MDRITELENALQNVINDYDSTGCENSGVVSEKVIKAAIKILKNKVKKQ